MTDQYEPFGPYYLTLFCENAEAAEIINTVYIDGFDSEADAWRACNGIGLKTINAIDESGEPTTVAGELVVQITITKAIGADFPHSFAA